MKIFKKGELELLWPFYLDILISRILFFFPAFIVIYFRDLGFTFFQISLLTMMMPLAMLLFEIPTGAISDLYGRKRSVILGFTLEGIGLFSGFFATTFYQFAIIFGFVGFASTLYSGSDEAWIADLIKSKRKKFLPNYFIKQGILFSTGMLTSGVLGALVVKYFGLSIIWLAGGSSCIASATLLLFAEEKFKKRKIKIKQSFKEIITQTKKSIKYSGNHPIIFKLLLASTTLIFASSFSGDISWIPLLKKSGFPDHAFGYMWSAMGVIGIIAPFITRKFMKNNERKFLMTCLALGISILLPLIFINSLAPIFTIFLLTGLFSRAMSPAERVYLHKFLPSKFRATIGSLEKTLIGLIAIIALPIAGLSVDHLGPKHTILLSGILMIPALITYYKIKENK